ncbi:hypothetical protein Tco_0319223 [Tanacetum coccineum]
MESSDQFIRFFCGSLSDEYGCPCSTCELCGNDAHYGYDCPSQVLFAYNQDPCFNQNLDNFPQTSLKSIDETPPLDSITPDLPITDSLVMVEDHLDTISETDSDEEIKSSVENLNLTPSESEDLFDYVSECDLPFCDNSPDFNNDFEIFSNPLFDSNADYTSSDDESSSEEDVSVENFKIYSNPLLKFDEEIFSSEINPLYNEVLKDLDSIPPGNENDHFNAESDLIETLLNKDTVITSPKIDFLLEEFAGELALINPIPPRIAETNFNPKEAIRLIKKLLYDNSSSRPPEELNSEISDAMIESFSSSPIPTIHTDITLPEYESFDDESDSASEIFNDDLAHIISPSEYEYVYANDESDSGGEDLTIRCLDYPDYEDSRARGFVQRSLDLHPFACLFWESYILDLID